MAIRGELRASGFWAAVLVLAPACAGRPVPEVRATLPAGAHLVSAASQTAAWCQGVRRKDICEDFRDVPIAEIVRFEREFPTILKANGFAHEAKALPTLERHYWGVLREGRLFVRGSLVCRQRLTDDGVVLLIPLCPSIDVTFPIGHPRKVQFLVG